MTTPSIPAGLDTARVQVSEEIKRADAKGSTLLSLVGIALAGVVALTGRTLPGAASVLLWVSAVPIAASVVLLLAAIRPRLGRTPVPGTWLHAASVGPGELLDSYSSRHEPLMVAAHVCVLARIARAKHRCIAAAVLLLGVGLAVLAAALICSALGI